MPNKPMESCTIVIHGINMLVRDPCFTLVHLIPSKLQLIIREKTSHTHSRTLVWVCITHGQPIILKYAILKLSLFCMKVRSKRQIITQFSPYQAQQSCLVF